MDAVLAAEAPILGRCVQGGDSAGALLCIFDN